MEASREMPAVYFWVFARTLGLEGYRIDQPDRIHEVRTPAITADLPVLAEAVTGPNIPSSRRTGPIASFRSRAKP
ncbi:MAG TPA: hypothetical protein VHK69_06275 [Chitinophagaceae bacterium]|jgi:pyruvate dehydrogenase (quinone)|nr:hypothetical protein [Chitinophagaceae bacterium]